MSRKDVVELAAENVIFYSAGDETAFFNWLNAIPCVLQTEGVGRVLHIAVDRSRVDEKALRELIAIFYRFHIEMRQLSAFDTEAFSSWYRSPKSYWFDQIFGRT